MLTPEALYDALDAALTRPERVVLPSRQIVLWLTTEQVVIGEGTWPATRARRARDGSQGFGYTRRQCAEMRAALLPVLGARNDQVEGFLRQAARLGGYG